MTDPKVGDKRYVPYFPKIKAQELTDDIVAAVINDAGELEAYTPEDEKIQYQEETWDGEKWR